MPAHLLVVAANLPLPDRASGDLRLSSLLAALTRGFRVTYCAYAAKAQTERLGSTEFGRYAAALAGAGVELLLADPVQVVQQYAVDVVLFEFYHAATDYLAELRFRCPAARMVVDTVDVHFNRYQAKARLTGAPNDLRLAQSVKMAELGTYRCADALIVVSEQERRLLQRHLVTVPVFVIPNFHVLKPLSPARQPGRAPELLFVGSFAHEPNADGVVFFCRDVLPLVLKQLPRARLTVVGAGAPPDVLALAGDAVQLLGYVEDLAPLFERCHVSIAPLRFGGGVKGKVGQAMAEGLPLVSTSTGVEGMTVTDGREVLVADDAHAFAAAIVRLSTDPALYSELRTAAWNHIHDTMSADRVGAQALAVMTEIAKIQPRKAPWSQRATRLARRWFDQRLMWRFRRS